MKALQQVEQMRAAMLAAITTHSACTTNVARKRSCSRCNQHAQKPPPGLYMGTQSFQELDPLWQPLAAQMRRIAVLFLGSVSL